MELTVYTDDCLWDTFVDAHYDSVLEEEIDNLLQAVLAWLGDLAGEGRVARAFEVEHAIGGRGQLVGPETSLELIEKIVGAQSGQEAFSQDATKGHSFSYFLKTFAFLGTLDRRQNIGLDIIENLVNWGDRIRSMPGSGVAAPMFEVVSRAARARFDLDMRRGADMDDFVCLLAIARWPIGEGLNSKILDLPRKTVQNLVSSKTILKDLNGRLDHKSASEWITPQFTYSYLFPSADIVSSLGISPARPAIEDPVFVPQIRCDRTLAIEPFLPDFRGEAGYEILNGHDKIICGDYFEALGILSSFPRSRVLRSVEAGQPVFGTALGTFVALDRKQLSSLLDSATEKESNEMPPAESFPATVGRALSELPSISIFPKGHSKKMLRFVSSKWGHIAIEPLISSANFYMLDSAANRNSFGAFITSSTGPGPSGRNSNLNTVPEFKGHSLIVMRVIDHDEAQCLLDAIAEKKSH